MKTNLRNPEGLQRRTTVTAAILVAISILVSIVLYDVVCLNLIRDRSDELDDMFIQTAVERTNRYLGEIAEIINMTAADPNLEILLTADPTDASQAYRIISAQNEYEKYLRNIILNYSQVSNFILLYGDNNFIVHEAGKISYREQVQDFYERTMPIMGAGEFYLLNLLGSRTEEISVLSPIFREGQEKPVGCLAVVLGKEFATQLRFAGEEIYIIDQLGEHSSLQGNLDTQPDRENLEQYPLIFEGWNLAAESVVDSIRSSFFANTWYFPLLGVGYLLFAVFFASRFSGRLLHPLHEMNRSLQRLAGRQEAEGHHSYRVPVFKKRLHFKERLLIFYTALVLIPAILSTIGFYLATQKTFDQRIGYFLEHRANFLFDQMNLTLQKYQRTAVEIAYNEEIQSYLDEGDGLEYESAVSRILLQKQTQMQGIMNIALFNMDRQLLYSSFYSRGFAGNEVYDNLFRQLEQNSYRTFWSHIYPSEFNKNRITVALAVFSFPPSANAGEKLGYLFLDFDASALESMATDFEKQGNSHIYLFKDSQCLFPEKDGPSMEQVKENGVLGSRLEYSYAKDNVLFVETLDGSGWTAIAEIPRQEYLRERTSILVTCLVIIILLAVLCVMVSYFSSAALSQNLEALVQFVKRIDRIGFAERFQRSSGDEIEELGNSFNDMLDTLDRLVNKQLEAERQYRSSQLAAKQFELNLLQSQINPHFLYNTLKTVQYMVHVQDPRAEKMVKLLIHLFRTGISKNERLVTVQEELRHVETYLEIQKIRFSDKFIIDIRMDDGAENLYLLKLTLQPIVENAIYHGLELLDRQGTLEITVHVQEDSLVITVADDGNGMTQERLQMVRDTLSNYQKSKSIGLYNVHERIRLYFGEPYGITINSEFRKGTQVMLRFPLIRSPQEIQLERLQPEE